MEFHLYTINYLSNKISNGGDLMKLLLISKQYVNANNELNYEIDSLNFKRMNKQVSLESSNFDGREFVLIEHIKIENTILAIIENEGIIYYIHCQKRQVIATPYINGFTDLSVDLKVELKYEGYSIEKTKYSYVIKDTSGNELELNNEIFKKGVSEIEELKRGTEEEPFIYLSITYGKYISFLEYTKKTDSFAFKTSFVTSLFNEQQIKTKLLSNNVIKLPALSKQSVKKSDLHRDGEIIILANGKMQLQLPYVILINNRSFLVSPHNSGKEIKINENKIGELLLLSSDFNVRQSEKGFVFVGKVQLTSDHFKVNQIVNKSGELLANVKMTDAHTMNFEIPFSKMSLFQDIHNPIIAAFNGKKLFRIQKTDSVDGQSKNLEIANKAGSSLILRLTVGNRFVITVLEESPIYTKSGMRKINFAKKIASLYRIFSRKKVNLYFEKNTSSASESGFAVFEAVKKDKSIQSTNRFVLDEQAAEYQGLKRKYGKDLITRYSLRHYINIFLAEHFISSELSNHVLAVRVFEPNLAKKIRSTPLYFLQHGIMFAKPIDNPMAIGFHKASQTNNLIKTVISSDLEANEFYRMGYEDSDLMKTGLPKLDVARLNDDASRIAFMPTWRYWEEGQVANGSLEKTTYYKVLIEVMEAFEKAGLLDRLLLVPHNKFAEFFTDQSDQYKDIICTNPSEALKQSVVFITDYSSIIYDSIYRGGYPIFYWKEKDYLIKNYQAVPSLNETNAPGKIAMDADELIAYVNEAINSNYVIPSDIKEKYLKINEFSDHGNTKRVLNQLKKDNVL